MSEPQKVAIITGADRGIGAGLAAAFRRNGYAVVATSLSIPNSDESDFLTVQGDITQLDTARRVVEQALDRFGRIDTLINNAGIYLGKPFTDYTLEDYAAITAVNLTGFFHITQRAVRQMVSQGSGHIVNVSTSLVDHADSTETVSAGVPHEGRARRRGPLAGDRVRVARRAGQRGGPRSHQNPDERSRGPGIVRSMAALHPLGRMGEISDVVDGVLYLERASFVTGEVLHIAAVRPLDTRLADARHPTHAGRHPRSSASARRRAAARSARSGPHARGISHRLH